MKIILIPFLLLNTFVLAEQSTPGPIPIGDQTAIPASATPDQIRGTGIRENLGTKINLDATFRDENNQEVKLSQYFHQGRPIILSFVYYSCANLCNFHLSGMAQSLSKFPWKANEKYNYVVISIDPKETPELAKSKKKDLLNKNPTSNAEEGWVFLTSPDNQVLKLSEQVGFDYKWNKEQGEWAHGSGAFVLTEAGVISRILYGIEFKPDMFKMALLESSQGKIGSFVDRVLMYCYHYDPQQRKYSFKVMKVMQAGGGLIFLFLTLLLGPVWIKNFRKQKFQGDN